MNGASYNIDTLVHVRRVRVKELKKYLNRCHKKKTATNLFTEAIQTNISKLAAEADWLEKLKAERAVQGLPAVVRISGATE